MPTSFYISWPSTPERKRNNSTFRITYLVTHSMQQSPWEANRFLASQEIPRVLWNSKVHYHIRMCPPHVPILSKLDPVHIPTFHFLKMHLNIILPSTPGSPKRPLSLRFPHQNPVSGSFLLHSRYIPRPYHSSRFYHPTNIGWEYRSFSSSICSTLHSRVISSLLGPNILLNTLFSNNLSLSFYLNVSDHVPHP